MTCAPIAVHGPHLPMRADIREGEGLSDAAAQKLLALDPDIRFIRLPPRVHGHGRAFLNAAA